MSKPWGKLTRIYHNNYLDEFQSSSPIPDEILLKNDLEIFGRLETNSNIIISVPFASSKHFTIERLTELSSSTDNENNKKRKIKLTDYSKNGTFVNDRHVGNGNTCFLLSDFIISLKYKEKSNLSYRFYVFPQDQIEDSHSSAVTGSLITSHSSSTHPSSSATSHPSSSNHPSLPTTNLLTTLTSTNIPGSSTSKISASISSAYVQQIAGLEKENEILELKLIEKNNIIDELEKDVKEKLIEINNLNEKIIKKDEEINENIIKYNNLNENYILIDVRNKIIEEKLLKKDEEINKLKDTINKNNEKILSLEDSINNLNENNQLLNKKIKNLDEKNLLLEENIKNNEKNTKNYNFNLQNLLDETEKKKKSLSSELLFHIEKSKRLANHNNMLQQVVQQLEQNNLYLQKKYDDSISKLNKISTESYQNQILGEEILTNFNQKIKELENFKQNFILYNTNLSSIHKISEEVLLENTPNTFKITSTQGNDDLLKENNEQFGTQIGYELEKNDMEIEEHFEEVARIENNITENHENNNENLEDNNNEYQNNNINEYQDNNNKEELLEINKDHEKIEKEFEDHNIENKENILSNEENKIFNAENNEIDNENKKEKNTSLITSQDLLKLSTSNQNFSSSQTSSDNYLPPIYSQDSEIDSQSNKKLSQEISSDFKSLPSFTSQSDISHHPEGQNSSELLFSISNHNNKLIIEDQNSSKPISGTNINTLNNEIEEVEDDEKQILKKTKFSNLNDNETEINILSTSASTSDSTNNNNNNNNNILELNDEDLVGAWDA